MSGRDNKGRFEKGHKETAEERLKRINANRIAWKQRPDYIGDLVAQCPHLYSVWRGIRFTDKGKAIGCSSDWENYRSFFNDVYPSYKDGSLFRRPDTSRPYSKDNFVWVAKGDESAFKSNSIYLTYKGETLLLKDWADQLNLSLAGLRLRYHRHKDDFTVEEILFGRKVARGSKKAKDVSDPSVLIRAKASKMISAYKNKDKKNGVSICDMDIEWMVLNVLSKPCVYCGDTHRVGADRIDNSKGHTKDNIVPCCYECNCARNSNFTFEEMKIIGKAIADVKSQRGVTHDNVTKEVVEKGMTVNNAGQVRWGAMKVYQYDMDWKLIRVYESIKQAATETGLSPKSIGAACNGKDYSGEHKLAGFRWEHK